MDKSDKIITSIAKTIEMTQMAIFVYFTTFPIFPPKWLRLTQNSQFHLFQSFPTETAHIDSEWLMSSDSQLFQLFPTEVAQINLEWPISPDSQLFQSFSTKVAQIDLCGQFHPIHNFSIFSH